MDPNQEITAGRRLPSISKDEWNRQTTVDARNVLQTHHSIDLTLSSHDSRTEKIIKPPSYPNHVLHPEIFPSLNEVPAELKKRRNVRGKDPMTPDGFENELPIEMATEFQDELQRAVQNRAAQDQNTDQQEFDGIGNDPGLLFQPVESHEGNLHNTSSIESGDFRPQYSSLTRSISYEKPTLRETFQRIKISGNAHDMTNIEDLQDSVTPLLSALVIREKYMVFSLQSFPEIVDSFLTKTFEGSDQSRRSSFSVPRTEVTSSFSSPPLSIPTPSSTCHPPIIKREDAFNIPLLPRLDMHVEAIDGIFRIYGRDKNDQWKVLDFPIMDRHMFIDDYTLLSTMITDGPLKSFCYRRLQYLKSKFELHCLLNEVKEWAAIKTTPHRDFYNVRKVDAHIHAASSMTQKHLLRFMKKKMKTSGDMQVYKTKDGRVMTLKEVFDELQISAYDLSVDMLGVHADRHTFQRFDRFNAKYNPVGQSALREIFLKTDNYIDGVFFADLLKEVISDLEDSKYQHSEPRLSIYGKSADEWDKLAKWCITNTMYSANVAWMVQIPRLYDVYRANGILNNFQELLTNLFLPLMEATIHPESHPELFRFLFHLTGFDSVDDESKSERPVLTSDMPHPEHWTSKENPPYVYYLFYMYTNIVILNHLRRSRGLNTFQFRPHCGEAGAVTHLVTAYMVAENISHGLLLRKSPVLQYLFYLCQIGIAMSPLSNNSLFINYNRNPMLEYFERGLCVSLSTDDPMQFHFTKEPLMEEYSIAAQVWKLSAVDMCELARNSVLTSGFSHEVKQYWLGPDYLEAGAAGNDIRRTNVPDIRMAYRYEALQEELRLLTMAYRHRLEQKEHHHQHHLAPVDISSSVKPESRKGSMTEKN